MHDDAPANPTTTTDTTKPSIAADTTTERDSGNDLSLARRQRKKLGKILVVAKKRRTLNFLRGPCDHVRAQALVDEFDTQDAIAQGRKPTGQATASQPAQPEPSLATLKKNALEILKDGKLAIETYYDHGDDGRKVFFSTKPAASRTEVDELGAFLAGLKLDLAGKRLLADLPGLELEYVERTYTEFAASVAEAQGQGDQAAVARGRRDIAGRDIRKLTPKAVDAMRLAHKKTPHLLYEYGITPHRRAAGSPRDLGEGGDEGEDKGKGKKGK